MGVSDVECKYKLSYEEQCDVLYNLACVAALHGQEADAANALNQLALTEAISAYDLVQDADLETLRSKEWFGSLLQNKSTGSNMKE